MKHKGLLISLLISTVTLSACSLLDFLSNDEASYSASKEGYEYVESKYLYKDYAKYNAYQNDYCPSIGEPKLLIIPIWFNDSYKYIATERKENVRDDIKKAYVGTLEENKWHSVSSFYKAESYGKCNITATISEWYSCGDNLASYAYETSSTVALVTKAVDWYFNNHTEDNRTNYDYDKNGLLDGVMLIYAAPDYQVLNNNASNLWAYCYWAPYDGTPSVTKPVPNAFFWASYDFMYSSGTRALRRTGFTYGNGDNSHCDVDAHTYIHEMGHVFGLDDYYDYSDEKYCPAGGFSMQDYNICGHDPFSTIALGWTTPMVVRNATTVELHSFQDDHSVLLLAPNYTGSPFDEYILVELYTPTILNKFDSDYQYSRFPKAPNVTGIRIWHIDARLVYYKYDFSKGDWLLDPTHIDNVLKPTEYSYCLEAFTNTYEGSDYGTQLGEYNSKYYNYNILQLIRNSTLSDIYNKNYCSSSDFFYAGDSFSINTFHRQFAENRTLNSCKPLGWNIRINSIRDGKANITINKE